jgi:hypothetical protein
MRRKIIFFGLTLFTASCGTKLQGIYIPGRKHSISYTSLQINNDKTFSYTLLSELQRDTLTGNWLLKKDTILLHIVSPINDDSIIKPEKVISRKDLLLSNGQIRLRIYVQDSTPFTLADVFINRNSTAQHLNNNGETMINGHVNTIRVEFQNLRPRIFIINSEINNDFTILIYDKAFVPVRYLTPVRKWIKRNKAIVPLNQNNIPFKNEFYKKVK